MNGLPEHTVRMWFPRSVRTYRVLELAERGDWTLSLVRTEADEQTVHLQSVVRRHEVKCCYLV